MTARATERTFDAVPSDVAWGCGGRAPGCHGDVRNVDAVLVEQSTATGHKGRSARCAVCAKSEGRAS